jgi:(p)ppGpp synthase/HD superfamily hydrolase
MENNNTTSSIINTSNQQITESYLEPCEYTTRLINKLKSLEISNSLDFGLINKAIYWARKYHGSQMRKSGESYYTHPLEVAYLIAEHNIRPTTNTIVASILHDIIEDTEVTAGMILDNFSFRIAEMVDALTRDRPDGTKLSVEEILYNAYIKKDFEVILIKIIDRLHNIMTTSSLSQNKITKISIETITNFLPMIAYLEKQYIESIMTKICLEGLNIKENKNTEDKKLPTVLTDSYLLSLIPQNDSRSEEKESQEESLLSKPRNN